jgi:riboflavin kinase/FMN adenylyltransferase
MSAQVHSSLDSAQGDFGPCALTIGNFDGVHRGHQALLKATCDYAREHGMCPAVLTFHPHPAVFVAPERVPELICPLDERVRLLSAAGAERILILPFNDRLARFTPAEFVSQILVQGLQAKAVFVGENFRFGHKQAGTTGTLTELGQIHDFAACFLAPVSYRGNLVSSSAVRQNIAAGNVAFAGRLLNRCFSLQGEVVKGHGIGSRETVPTLNIKPPEGQIIPRGVYITQTVEPATGRVWPSITNSGTRPTFDGTELTVETFLLAPLDGLSPGHIRIEFRRFIRAERQFPDSTALRRQIMVDVGRANAFWRRVRRGTARKVR